MGANVVLGVNLNARQPIGRVDLLSEVPTGPTPSMLETITRTLDLMQGRVAAKANSATFVIEPAFAPLPGWGMRRSRDSRQLIQAGEAAAAAALARVSAVLPWVDSL
jgi:hypothetical protein